MSYAHNTYLNRTDSITSSRAVYGLPPALDTIHKQPDHQTKANAAKATPINPNPSPRSTHPRPSRNTSTTSTGSAAAATPSTVGILEVLPCDVDEELKSLGVSLIPLPRLQRKKIRKRITELLQSGILLADVELASEPVLRTIATLNGTIEYIPEPSDIAVDLIHYFILTRAHDCTTAPSQLASTSENKSGSTLVSASAARQRRNQRSDLQAMVLTLLLAATSVSRPLPYTPTITMSGSSHQAMVNSRPDLSHRVHVMRFSGILNSQVRRQIKTHFVLINRHEMNSLSRDTSFPPPMREERSSEDVEDGTSESSAVDHDGEQIEEARGLHHATLQVGNISRGPSRGYCFSASTKAMNGTSTTESYDRYFDCDDPKSNQGTPDRCGPLIDQLRSVLKRIRPAVLEQLPGIFPPTKGDPYKHRQSQAKSHHQHQQHHFRDTPAIPGSEDFLGMATTALIGRTGGILPTYPSLALDHGDTPSFIVHLGGRPAIVRFPQLNLDVSLTPGDIIVAPLGDMLHYIVEVQVQGGSNLIRDRSQVPTNRSHSGEGLEVSDATLGLGKKDDGRQDEGVPGADVDKVYQQRDRLVAVLYSRRDLEQRNGLCAERTIAPTGVADGNRPDEPTNHNGDSLNGGSHNQPINGSNPPSNALGVDGPSPRGSVRRRDEDEDQDHVTDPAEADDVDMEVRDRKRRKIHDCDEELEDGEITE
ncbi:hypothetical protein IAT40_003857 [Kwoniella sp. CBS 6097]